MKKIIIFIVLALVVAIGCFVGSTASCISSSLKDLSVKNEIKVTSNVTNVIKQEYKSTVSGIIKNNTSNDLNNLTIKINVKTNTLGHTGYITLTGVSIPAKGSCDIYKVVDTTENFETITSIVVNGSSFSNYILDNKSESIFTGKNLLVGCGIIIVVGTAVYIFVKVRGTKNQVVVSQKPVQNSSVNKDREIQDLKNTLEKERLKNEINSLKGNEVAYKEKDEELIELENTLKKEKIKKELDELNKPKVKYCQYCGAKNNKDDTKCINCGASI